MDWTKILSAIALGLMLVALLPHAKRMLADSPHGSAADWRAAVLPILAVAAFVVFLVYVNRGP